MQKAKKTLLIVDGFALIFRAFYAFIRNPLITSSGKPSSAVFGFTRMLIKLLKTYKPDYFVIALDSPHKTFRHALYEDYKANRDEAPLDLKEQIPVIIDLIKKFKISTLIQKGYEADDIIGTLCEDFKKHDDIDVFVCTGDKDILQLIENNIKVLNLTKGVSELVLYDRKKVKEKHLVYPEQIVDLLSLMGDSSDNIPGVRGIGAKSATMLLSQFKSVEDIYNNIDKVARAKVKDMLTEGKENAILSKELVTIKKDLVLNYTLRDFENTSLDNEEAKQLLQEYELYSVLEDNIFHHGKNANNESKETEKTKANYKTICSKSELFKLKEEIAKEKLVSIVITTDNKNPIIAKIIGFSVSIKEASGYYVPLLEDKQEGKTEDMQKEALDKEFLLSNLKAICEDEGIAKIGHGIKYDYMLLKRYSIELKGIAFDTMIASYVLDPSRQSHSLEYLAGNMLSYKTISYKDVIRDKKQTLFDVSSTNIKNLVAEKADITLRLYKKLKEEISTSISYNLYYDIELPLVTVLADMELIGVCIDSKHFISLSHGLLIRITELKRKIHAKTDAVFNINSTKQLSDILFNKLGLKHTKKTKTGYSTDNSVLEELAKEGHDVPKYLLEYRKLNKLKSGYLDPLPALVNPNTNRIHTSFNQTITHTGRLSSSKPNIQNIPIKGDMGDEIRQGFICDDNYFIMSADYSQIELRILAHYSKDEKLIKAYKEDKDIHAQTASLIFQKEQESITTKERQIAKTINFSVIYGIGAKALAKDLGIETKMAKLFIDNYFKEYKDIKAFMEGQIQKAYDNGYVESLFGRIRFVPELFQKNKMYQSFGERLAVNTPIQATSADLIKIAMIKIDTQINKQKLKSKMIMQVHDELVFEVFNKELAIMKEIVKSNMEDTSSFLVPIKVSIAHGKNWLEAHS